MNPQDLQNLLDTLNQFSAKLGTIADDIRNNVNQNQNQVNQNNNTVSRSWTKLGEATDKLTKRLDDNVKSAQRNNDSTKRTEKQQDDAVKFFSRGIRQSTVEFGRNLQTGKISLNEFRDQINEAKESIRTEQNLKVQQKQDLMREIENLDKNAQLQAKYGYATEQAGKALGQLGKIAGAVGGATLDVVRSYQSSSSQIGISTAAMSAGVNLAGTGLSMVGEGASAAGMMISTFSRGIGRYFGLALQVAGFGASFAGKGLTDLGKVVLPILNAELEKQIQSFQTISNVGAIFADGVDGMRKASNQAGLDLGMLSNVFKNNSEQFANSGLGMSAVMERFAGARQRSIADGFQKQLLNLGYSVEQQGGLMAQVFQQLGRSGRAQTATSEEIAKQTLEYGKTLKVITELTGADAAKRMQEASRQLQEVQMDAKIREMEAKDPGARARIEAILATVPDELKLGVKQQFVLGQVVDEATNVLISQSPKMGQAMDTIVGAMQDTSIDAQKGAAITVSVLRGARDQLAKDLRDIGTAALADPTSFIAPYAEKANKIIAQTQSFADGLTAGTAPKRTEDAAQTQNKATAAMNKVIENNIKMAQKIQDLVLDTDIMGKYARAMTDLTDTVIRQIAKFGDKTGTDNENDKSTGAKIGGKVVSAAPDVLGGIIGAKMGPAIGSAVATGLTRIGLGAITRTIGGLLGTWAGPAGIVAGGIMGGYLGDKLGDALQETEVGKTLVEAGEKVGDIVEASVEIAKAGFTSIIGMFKSAPHAKQGGIIQSDLSGSVAMLHGTEAVLPLDDNTIMGKLRNSLMPETKAPPVETKQVQDIISFLKNSQDNNSIMLRDALSNGLKQLGITLSQSHDDLRKSQEKNLSQTQKPDASIISMNEYIKNQLALDQVTRTEEYARLSSQLPEELHKNLAAWLVSQQKPDTTVDDKSVDAIKQASLSIRDQIPQSMQKGFDNIQASLTKPAMDSVFDRMDARDRATAALLDPTGIGKTVASMAQTIPDTMRKSSDDLHSRMFSNLKGMLPGNMDVQTDLLKSAISRLTDLGSISSDTNKQIKQQYKEDIFGDPDTKNQLKQLNKVPEKKPTDISDFSDIFIKNLESFFKPKKQENLPKEDIFGDTITSMNTQLQGSFLNINDTLAKTIPQSVTAIKDGMTDSRAEPKESTGIISELNKAVSQLLPNMSAIGATNTNITGAINNLNSLSDVSNKNIDDVSQALVSVKDSMQAVVQQKPAVSEDIVQSITGKVMSNMEKTLEENNLLLAKISSQMADMVDHSRATSYNTEQMKYAIQ